MYQEEPHIHQGRIEVICGSMFSGKTEELIRRLKRARIARQKVEIYKPSIDTQIITDGTVAEDHTFDAVSGYAGAYFSLPLTPRWQIGTKALAGYVHYPRLRLKTMDIGTRDSATFGTGVSATYRATDHYNARFFVDYNLLPSHSRGSREWMSTLAAGLSFAVAI